MSCLYRVGYVQLVDEGVSLYGIIVNRDVNSFWNIFILFVTRPFCCAWLYISSVLICLYTGLDH